jgi:hypothetical protein
VSCFCRSLLSCGQGQKRRRQTWTKTGVTCWVLFGSICHAICTLVLSPLHPEAASSGNVRAYTPSLLWCLYYNKYNVTATLLNCTIWPPPSANQHPVRLAFYAVSWTTSAHWNRPFTAAPHMSVLLLSLLHSHSQNDQGIN